MFQVSCVHVHVQQAACAHAQTRLTVSKSATDGQGMNCLSACVCRLSAKHSQSHDEETKTLRSPPKISLALCSSRGTEALSPDSGPSFSFCLGFGCFEVGVGVDGECGATAPACLPHSKELSREPTTSVLAADWQPVLSGVAKSGTSCSWDGCSSRRSGNVLAIGTVRGRR